VRVPVLAYFSHDYSESQYSAYNYDGEVMYCHHCDRKQRDQSYQAASRERLQGPIGQEDDKESNEYPENLWE